MKLTSRRRDLIRDLVINAYQAGQINISVLARAVGCSREYAHRILRNAGLRSTASTQQGTRAPATPQLEILRNRNSFGASPVPAW